MGNGIAKLTHCFSGDGQPIRRRHIAAAVTSEPYDEGLGHSFCYIRPDLPSAPISKIHHSDEPTTTFRLISGAAVSANTSTALSTSLLLPLDFPSAAAFESSTSFSSIPLQPIPRFSGPLAADRGFLSGPIERGFLSGPIAADRGFLSGPIERGFLSGPLDHRADLFSAPLDKIHSLATANRLRRSLSHGGAALRHRSLRVASSLLRGLTKTFARSIPAKSAKKSDSADSGPTSVEVGDEYSDSFDNLQWAQGKAGEDRVHVVISEEHGWVFVGIYDGFNGPDATDYLLSNLYSAVQRELKGLLWDELPSEDDPITSAELGRQSSRSKCRGAAKKWEELDKRLKEQFSRSNSENSVNHSEVLKALSRALTKTEEAYLDVADQMVSENPELALMGSCVLVMLMKGEDVYLMNVGDSRAVLAQKGVPGLWGSIGKERQDLERINEETLNDLEGYDGGDEMDEVGNLAALQLTLDHSTCVEEEVCRIRNEHSDDASAIVNDRVKGSLKVTRAFGAGFLKQPKWNNALLEMFRIDYIGTSPYITCSPSLYHHRLGSRDRFLILSSDGLYQYFTNEEAVVEVGLFIATTPEGDPAQHLVEEVLFRAAKKAGMDFHELLEIPQGDRRRYHDDVSIIVISLEGRIWRSCV